MAAELKDSLFIVVANKQGWLWSKDDSILTPDIGYNEKESNEPQEIVNAIGFDHKLARPAVFVTANARLGSGVTDLFNIITGAFTL